MFVKVLDCDVAEELTVAVVLLEVTVLVVTEVLLESGASSVRKSSVGMSSGTQPVSDILHDEHIEHCPSTK